MSSSITRAAVSGVRLGGTRRVPPDAVARGAGEDAGAEKGLPSAAPSGGGGDPSGGEVTTTRVLATRRRFPGDGVGRSRGRRGGATRGPPRGRRHGGRARAGDFDSAAGAGARPGELASRRRVPRRVSIPSTTPRRVLVRRLVNTRLRHGGMECRRRPSRAVRCEAAAHTDCPAPGPPRAACSSPQGPVLASSWRRRRRGASWARSARARRIVLTAARTPRPPAGVRHRRHGASAMLPRRGRGRSSLPDRAGAGAFVVRVVVRVGDRRSRRRSVGDEPARVWRKRSWRRRMGEFARAEAAADWRRTWGGVRARSHPRDGGPRLADCAGGWTFGRVRRRRGCGTRGSAASGAMSALPG